MTAIVLVSALLLTVSAAASAAKSMAIALEAASYGLIALTGVWLIWQALRPRLAVAALPVEIQGTHYHHLDSHDHVGLLLRRHAHRSLDPAAGA